MTCEECLLAMQDELDAELTEPNTSLFASHAAHCGNCAREYQFLQRERKMYAQYSRDIEVAPALWQAVRRRLDLNSAPLSRRKSLTQWVGELTTIFRPTPVLTACLILLAIGLVALVLKVVPLRQSEPRDGIGLQESRSPLPPASTSKTTDFGPVGVPIQQRASKSLSIQPEHETRSIELGFRASTSKTATKPMRRAPTVEELVAQAEQKYLEAIALLSRDVEKPGSKLDPSLRAEFRETLVAIDRTIAETRRAVGQHPTDPEAVRYLLTAYAKKVEVLQEMASY